MNEPEIWWRLTPSKLKAKSESALVLKAWHSASNIREEVLEIRFYDQSAAIQFAKKYHNILPYMIENIFQRPQHLSSNPNNPYPQNEGIC